MERIMTLNLSVAYKKSTTKRARYAMHLLKELVARHTKVDFDKVFVSEPVNDLVWSGSMKKPPKRIKVKIVTDEKGATVILPEEEKPKPPEKLEKPPEKPEEVEEKEEKVETKEEKEVKKEKMKKK